MIFFSGTSEQATVDSRVQGFDSSAKDFGRFGVIGYFCDIDIVFTQYFGCAAGGEQGPAEGDKSLGEIEKTCFVVNRENGSRHK